MDWLEALILGILQGLTEFLPVSSSGHLEIGKVILGVDAERSLIFTIVVHGATVLSTIVVFRNDIIRILRGFFLFQWNDEMRFVVFVLLSMIPVGLVALFMDGGERLEVLFTGNMVLVGSMLLITSMLLTFTRFARTRGGAVGPWDAVIIGIAQAVAVLPGISRSGATIATGLLLGKGREEITRFSFLMVLIPILGQNFLSLISGDMAGGDQPDVTPMALMIGFIGAFFAGLFACSWMIRIVKRGDLIWFAIYCFIVGTIAIGYGIGA